MCDDHVHAQLRPALSRRGLLQGTASLAVLAALGAHSRAAAAARSSTTAVDGYQPLSMSMHTHSSFSEFTGSMQAQLASAVQAGVDVLWWTDHDHRMSGVGFRNTVHFSSLTAESGAAGEGGVWHWTQVSTGTAAAGSSGGIVSAPASPLDPVPEGALSVSVRGSRRRQSAALGYFANAGPAKLNYHGNLFGQTMDLEVLPTAISPTAYLELLVSTSYHPAHSGRPAGAYAISYRFGGSGTPGSRVATGLLGVVTLPATKGRWNSVTINPAADIAALWPDMDARDFALYGITLSAVSGGDRWWNQAAGYFDYLRFHRPTGEVLLAQQRDLMVTSGAAFPSVCQQYGLEISPYDTHLNWFGGAVRIPDLTGVDSSAFAAYMAENLIPDIHASGGLVSYNHPFGYQNATALLSQSVQQKKLGTVVRNLLQNKALGADIIEVGYRLRAGVDLAHHVGVWDSLSRNAVFLTGNGVTDDHYGQGWLQLQNNWATTVWAPDTAESSLLAALAAGRAYTASMTGYGGCLDLLADGTCPMGSASVSALPARSLQLTATALPAGGSLQLVQGAVDYAGTAHPQPSSSVVASYSATDLVGEQVVAAVDTTASSFVRTQVLNASGAVVGLSNPVWLLRESPRRGIPRQRAA